MRPFGWFFILKITLLQNWWQLFSSYRSLMIPPKMDIIYNVRNKLVRQLSFWKSNRAFQKPIPVLSLQAASVSPAHTVAISVHTAALFWQVRWLPDPSCPAAAERFMTLVRPFTFDVSFVILCVCISALSRRGAPFLAVAIAIPCILLVAVLNCLTASGLQSLTGQVFCLFHCTKLSTFVSHNNTLKHKVSY